MAVISKSEAARRLGTRTGKVTKMLADNQLVGSGYGVDEESVSNELSRRAEMAKGGNSEKISVDGIALEGQKVTKMLADNQPVGTVKGGNSEKISIDGGGVPGAGGVSVGSIVSEDQNGVAVVDKTSEKEAEDIEGAEHGNDDEHEYRGPSGRPVVNDNEDDICSVFPIGSPDHGPRASRSAVRKGEGKGKVNQKEHLGFWDRPWWF